MWGLVSVVPCFDTTVLTNRTVQSARGRSAWELASHACMFGSLQYDCKDQRLLCFCCDRTTLSHRAARSGCCISVWGLEQVTDVWFAEPPDLPAATNGLLYFVCNVKIAESPGSALIMVSQRMGV